MPRVTLYPGDVIGDVQLVARAFIAHTVTRASVVDSRDALIGKVARRTLLPGQPVPVGGVRDPYMVNQGKTAVVVFEADGLSISTSALALQNGGIGDLEDGEVKTVTVTASREGGEPVEFEATVRLDTPNEVTYFINGGILQTVLRNLKKLAGRGRGRQGGPRDPHCTIRVGSQGGMPTRPFPWTGLP